MPNYYLGITQLMKWCINFSALIHNNFATLSKPHPLILYTLPYNKCSNSFTIWIHLGRRGTSKLMNRELH